MHQQPRRHGENEDRDGMDLGQVDRDPHFRRAGVVAGACGPDASEEVKFKTEIPIAPDAQAFGRDLELSAPSVVSARNAFSNATSTPLCWRSSAAVPTAMTFP